MCAYNISVVRDPLWPLSSISWAGLGAARLARHARAARGRRVSRVAVALPAFRFLFVDSILSGPDSATAVFLLSSGFRPECTHITLYRFSGVPRDRPRTGPRRVGYDPPPLTDSHTQHAPGPGAITKKVATPLRAGKACR